jgi:hypothetical protein
MANAIKKRRFIATKPIEIDFPNGAKPHDPVFTGSDNVHKRGHIWLKDYDDGDLRIAFKLTKQGYRFVSNVAGDGTDALYISTDPTDVTFFNPNGNALLAPSLSDADTYLEFFVHKSDSNKYFYILNLIDSREHKFSLKDPIIVNR